MSLFDEYNVYVQESDGSTYKYLEIGILAANGRAGLYRSCGLKSWIERNDYVLRSKRAALKEIKEFVKLVQEDSCYGISEDPLCDLPQDGVIDEDK